MYYIAFGCLFLYFIYMIWKVRRYFQKNERLKEKYRIKEEAKHEKNKKKEELKKEDGEFHNIEDIVKQ